MRLREVYWTSANAPKRWFLNSKRLMQRKVKQKLQNWRSNIKRKKTRKLNLMQKWIVTTSKINSLVQIMKKKRQILKKFLKISTVSPRLSLTTRDNRKKLSKKLSKSELKVSKSNHQINIVGQSLHLKNLQRREHSS